ncbi:hypothetical protein [Marinomonas sp.]|uniref:cyanobactin maturation protease PatG family protein n=1 Tax=Marinomonas sp. TaxID=1904862 RepID=UPI003BAA2F7C
MESPDQLDNTNNLDTQLNNEATPLALPEKPTDLMQFASIEDANADFIASLTSSIPIYVAGTLRVIFPNKGLEKECEAAAQEISAQKKDSVAPYDYGRIFGYKDCANKQANGACQNNGVCQCPKPYRYLAEQVNWILSVDDQDAYLLEPNSIVELNEFIFFLKQVKKSSDLLCVIAGEKIGNKTTTSNDPTSLPTVRCKHIFEFDMKPEVIKNKLIECGNNTTTEAIQNLIKLLDTKNNFGITDFERAKNFLAFRYPTIYKTRASEYQTKASGHSSKDPYSTADDNDASGFLLSIETKYSDSADGHKIVDVIFHYQRSISGRLYSYYASVDVSHIFPYLHSPLTNYVSLTN